MTQDAHLSHPIQLPTTLTFRWNTTLPFEADSESDTRHTSLRPLRASLLP